MPTADGYYEQARDTCKKTVYVSQILTLCNNVINFLCLSMQQKCTMAADKICRVTNVEN